VFVERAYRLAQPLYVDVRTVCSKDGEMERDERILTHIKTELRYSYGRADQATETAAALLSAI
jgi:hypothetical protein